MTFTRRKTAKMISVVVCTVLAGAFLPGLIPFAAFGLFVYFFGTSLVSFFLATFIAVLIAWIYPHFLNAKAAALYNGGGDGSPIHWVDPTEFVMAPMGEAIIGLLFVNAFFVLGFESSHFRRFLLPRIRSLCKTRRSRLSAGYTAAALNFVDDLAAGGILNRFFKSDIASPGVKPAIRRQMLLMILLIANSITAIVPFSTWSTFYQEQIPGWEKGWFAWSLFPLVAAIFCFWIAIDPRPWIQKKLKLVKWKTCDLDAKSGNVQKSVLDFDFLREPPYPTTAGPMVLCTCTPIAVVVVCLLCGFALIPTFALGIVIQLIGNTTLAWVNHFHGTKGNAFLESNALAEADAALAAAETGLLAERSNLLSPFQAGGNARSANPLETVKELEDTVSHFRAARKKLQDTAEISKRIHPSLPASKHFFWRFACIWDAEGNEEMRSSVKGMVGDLLRVYMILIVACAIKVCIGMPLDTQDAVDSQPTIGVTQIEERNVSEDAYKKNISSMENVAQMLKTTSLPFKWINGQEVLPISTDGQNKHPIFSSLQVVTVFIITVVLLFGMSFLRLSSAWGILAICYPISMAMLSFVGAATDAILLGPIFFGLIVSFGIWCNCTQETGDNVEIAAGIHDKPAESLARLSAKYCTRPILWPCIIILGLAVIIEPWLRTHPLMGSSAPVLIAVLFSFVVYWMTRNDLHSPIDEEQN
jgi:hypothetical protein